MNHLPIYHNHNYLMDINLFVLLTLLYQTKKQS